VRLLHVRTTDDRASRRARECGSNLSADRSAEISILFSSLPNVRGLELELLPAAKALAPRHAVDLVAKKLQASLPISREMWFAKAGLMLDWWT